MNRLSRSKACLAQARVRLQLAQPPPHASHPTKDELPRVRSRRSRGPDTLEDQQPRRSIAASCRARAGCAWATGIVYLAMLFGVERMMDTRDDQVWPVVAYWLLV